MAARRLIIVLVILFGVSIAAAAIAPERRQLGAADESSTTTSTDANEEAGGDEPAGEVLEARIQASAAKPETVRARVGDQLVLDVAAGSTLQVEIQPLGLLAAAAEGAPARFDLLLREPGALPVTDALTDEVIGRVLVTEEGEAAKPDQGRSRQPNGDPERQAPQQPRGNDVAAA